MQYLTGRTFPLGSQITEFQGKQGVNFAIFSRKATAIELCLFKEQGEMRLPMVKSDDIWHLFVVDETAGCEYGFRVYGETDETVGNLFNPNKLLLDPYAKKIIGTPDLSSEEKGKWFLWNDERDNAHLAPKSIVVDANFDWQNSRPPMTPWAETIIYETQVKGFSKLNPDIPTEISGTFAGMAHPSSISHLKRLGITAVELLPITYHIDEPHLQKIGLSNYWGYNVIGHFAVDPVLAFDKQNPLNEFKTLVKTLHQANIEVILDVVFNHTAEAGKDGPMLSLRGIDNSAYYWLNEDGDYHNWSGCGNALNANSEMSVLRWVIDCLSYWVTECQVDGFRFDLGAMLGRTPDFSDRAAFFSAIASNSTLANIKMIAEPWDIGSNGYQLGRFPKPFAEWNDRYRDEMRQFFLTTSGQLSSFARKFAGSDDIFGHNRLPNSSINFITAHDGFNLQDLVSYNQKHNHANGENNRDGHNHNLSNNYGVEGETNDLNILAKRDAARRALLTTLLLSAGTPMILAGDELGHSQQGNNNSYCQDNPITWIDWQKADQSLIDYVAEVIQLRKQIPLLSHNQWWTTDTVQWLNKNSNPISPNEWHDETIRSLMILLENEWLILINATQKTQQFLLPEGQWQALLGLEKATLMTDTQAVTLNDLGVCVLQRII
ncbi:glycogen debranching protein GlgX [Ursidibacter maritimus]|uniref:Glycogen debranching protein GlgX n=1 Tax=Ursidibacter maritimus TaxID=1331689 RepID=A0A949T3W0_9PAST|nr:glycogen debranching protein GlgX [Ursidibacter maritimus]KAE9539246.1 glycogen debranching enzyme [Ursidibacter maritimus]MBV6523937.1 glycogen debranching protein GlgX [Ursidibacter maritimus]MBV6525759.1 glycogen debranching protein GlgX [Ursidibacter maritimus]MBV6526891.1 glycogen debranching protein GlgX [Ursidibacter maritimus]MBV6530272.1 glycogen debranching protein GlgX [Ursidibacter maritimus]